MQRYEWLCQDSVRQASRWPNESVEDYLKRTDFPVPHETSLELLGFLLPDDRRVPAPVRIMARYHDKTYILDQSGGAHQITASRTGELRGPDITMSGSVCVGDVAFALSSFTQSGGIYQPVIYGPPHHVRKLLRCHMTGPDTARQTRDSVFAYFNWQAESILRARAYGKSGLKGLDVCEAWLRVQARGKARRPSVSSPGLLKQRQVVNG